MVSDYQHAQYEGACTSLGEPAVYSKIGWAMLPPEVRVQVMQNLADAGAWWPDDIDLYLELESDDKPETQEVAW